MNRLGGAYEQGGFVRVLRVVSRFHHVCQFRLVELRRLVAKVIKASTEQFSIDALLPLMQRRVVEGCAVQGRRPAHALFYLLEGTLHLPEIDKDLEPGTIIGEVALFSDTGRRTATAKTDCIVMSLTKSAVFSALVQHPQLGIHLLKMATVRMLENADRHSPSWPPAKAEEVPGAAIPATSGQ